MTGADVKRIRTQLGLTQSELGHRLNAIDSNLRVHAASVSRWESGRLNPSAHAAAALRILDSRVSSGDTSGGLRASEHLEMAAAGFEADGSVKLAAILRRLADGQREGGHDPIQVSDDGEKPH